VVFRSLVWLPQTTVTIFARELRFEDNPGEEPAALRTTPINYGTVAVHGTDGQQGLKAGDVILRLERFHSDAGNTERLDLRGGMGQRVADTRRPGTSGEGGSVYSTIPVGPFSARDAGPGGEHCADDISLRGDFIALDQPYAWFHPFALRAIVLHAKDAYLNGNLSYVQDVLESNLAAFGAFHDPQGELADDLDELEKEIVVLLNRINNNLDYT
jgi:hypothetical protein